MSSDDNAVPVTLTQADPQGMISLRGDLQNAALQKVCIYITGVAMPAKGQIVQMAGQAIAWMSPDELLIMLPYQAVEGAVTQIGDALSGHHHLVANVSDARVMMTLTGCGLRDVLAKLAPVDLHPDHFTVGQFRRTRLGQVAAAFWLSDPLTCHVICFRSVAAYCQDLLISAAQHGRVDCHSRIL